MGFIHTSTDTCLKNLTPNNLECENCEFCWINNKPSTLEMKTYNSKQYCRQCYTLQKIKDDQCSTYYDNIDVTSKLFLSIEYLNAYDNWCKMIYCDVKANCFYCKNILKDENLYPFEYGQEIVKYGQTLYIFKPCTSIILCDYCMHYRNTNVYESILDFIRVKERLI